MPAIASRAKVKALVVVGALALVATAAIVAANALPPFERLHVDPPRSWPEAKHGGLELAATLDAKRRQVTVTLTRPLGAANHSRPPLALAIALDDGAPLAGAGASPRGPRRSR